MPCSAVPVGAAALSADRERPRLCLSGGTRTERWHATPPPDHRPSTPPAPPHSARLPPKIPSWAKSLERGASTLCCAAAQPPLSSGITHRRRGCEASLTAAGHLLPRSIVPSPQHGERHRLRYWSRISPWHGLGWLAASMCGGGCFPPLAADRCHSRHPVSGLSSSL